MELFIYDRNYTNWQFKQLDATEPVSTLAPYIDPLASKLYHGDTVSSTGALLQSPYKAKTAIPGVLVLDGKTYGRATDAKNDKLGKLLYKCIPNDPALPCFLIPYEEKHSAFLKKKCNKYITFKIKDWPDKHPVGQLTNTLGDVTQPECYYQYQLACKNLQQPITAFNKETMAKLNSLPREKITSDIAKHIPHLDDRRHSEHIFSIDPPGCKDIDDAIGLRVLDKQHSIISIYIANVALVLDYLDLWAVYSERVSTIYLPTGRIPMLPPILADDICSLLQGEDRWAFCLDIHLRLDTTEPTVTQLVFKPVLLKVEKNYVYEEAALLRNKTYGQLFSLTQALNKHYKYVDQVTDSHDLVEFYMIFMNYESSKELLQHELGIFRSAQLSTGTVFNTLLSKEMQTFIKSFTINHCAYCTSKEVRPHDLIGKGLTSYVHITSPIRRLVDLANQIDMQRTVLSPQANVFSTAWGKRLAYINTTMKAIRKVQNNCTLLATYLQQPHDIQHYTGLVFDKTVLPTAIYQPKETYKYSIYIPSLKMVSTIKTENNYDNYRTVVVSTHAFSTEDNIIKKIRLQIV
jgi:exoribonuclease R